ncbi:imidazole glycerol phosphate synthase subunit HisH [Pelagibius sp. 7325]|uniref:imidazole glycerol phosphate synthase subunit HisH n=1 Tax=Pelagibius sp. 7325 TaxID=3131994 RepID=UPI0030EEF0E1
MTVAIIDYGSGNLRSAAKSLERAAKEAGGGPVVVTADPEAVRRADRVVLPGVGAFADCRRGVLAIDGMMQALEETVIGAGRPFLGICVGMQLMAARGLEHGTTEGFGWIPGDVVALNPERPATGEALKVPHMGWNALALRDSNHPLVAGFGETPYVYFVHSYHLRPADPAQLLATVDYGGPVTAMVGRDNLAGTQFHPEKSQSVGLRLLANFLRWRP